MMFSPQSVFQNGVENISPQDIENFADSIEKFKSDFTDIFHESLNLLEGITND